MGWLQWGHGDEAVEEASGVEDEAWEAMLQWGHGDEAVEEADQAAALQRIFNFNGATAMKPWKRNVASPCLWARSHFNGATAMKPWKSLERRAERLHIRALQWGHGDEAVEEDKGLREQDTKKPTSMGPRR